MDGARTVADSGDPLLYRMAAKGRQKAWKAFRACQGLALSYAAAARGRIACCQVRKSMVRTKPTAVSE